MSNATFLGHGSLKFCTNDGKYIYVDPFFNGDYSESASILLVTHNHFDHADLTKVQIGSKCLIVMPEDAIAGGDYKTFDHEGVKITAVEAYNKNHNKEECCGYVLEFDGLKVYCAGDTSVTSDMEKKLPKMGLDYVFLPTDGIYNMGPEEATLCAAMLKPKKGAFPIHNDPQSTKDFKQYDTNLPAFSSPVKRILAHGETIEL